MLADAADVLSDQLRMHLQRMAWLLHPHAAALERQFQRRLKEMEIDALERGALSAITPGAVARVLTEGRTPASFFEQVEYHGRRLAKLNLLPSQILAALAEYDRLLAPVLEKLSADERANFQWVREQLQFCVVLTLNNAYYQVREAETQAFYELFRVELESRNLDELLERFLLTLAQFCHADAAHLFWLDGASWRHKASIAANAKRALTLDGIAFDRRILRRLMKPCCSSWSQGEAPSDPVLDQTWIRRFESCWSVPLLDQGKLAGVVQLGFRKTYEWLPREQELLAAAAERCIVATQKARLLEDLAEREEQVRRLAEHMMHVEEAERRRISRELHDEAGQSLLCVRLNLEMIEKSLPQGEARTKLAEVREMTEGTILEIRRLIAALSPAVLDQLGLGAALRHLVMRFRQVHPAKVRLQLSRISNLPKKLEIIVYRVVQECFHNIAKHSSANHVNISATTADGKFRLSVEDDGVGFHVREALEKHNSFGLSGIRERVALLGGTFLIESWPRSTGKTANGGGSQLSVVPSNGKVPCPAGEGTSDGTGLATLGSKPTARSAERPKQTALWRKANGGESLPNREYRQIRQEEIGPNIDSKILSTARKSVAPTKNKTTTNSRPQEQEQDEKDRNSSQATAANASFKRDSPRSALSTLRIAPASFQPGHRVEELDLVNQATSRLMRPLAQGKHGEASRRAPQGWQKSSPSVRSWRFVGEDGAPIGTRISIELPISQRGVRR